MDGKTGTSGTTTAAQDFHRAGSLLNDPSVTAAMLLARRALVRGGVW